MKQYLTIPNGLTALRGLGVPLFIWLALDLHADGWAILVLAIGGVTDYQAKEEPRFTRNGVLSGILTAEKLLSDSVIP